MLSAPLATPAERKNIGATISIGREIWCLLFAGFLLAMSQIQQPADLELDI